MHTCIYQSTVWDIANARMKRSNVTKLTINELNWKIQNSKSTTQNGSELEPFFRELSLNSMGALMLETASFQLSHICTLPKRFTAAATAVYHRHRTFSAKFHGFVLLLGFGAFLCHCSPVASSPYRGF